MIQRLIYFKKKLWMKILEFSKLYIYLLDVIVTYTFPLSSIFSLSTMALGFLWWWFLEKDNFDQKIISQFLIETLKRYCFDWLAKNTQSPFVTYFLLSLLTIAPSSSFLSHICFGWNLILLKAIITRWFWLFSSFFVVQLFFELAHIFDPSDIFG